MDQPPWLDDTERRAWLSMVAFVLVGMPQLDRTLRQHGLVNIEYGVLAALSSRPDGMRLTELATGGNMSASRLTHRLRKLVEHGYVEVRGCAEDGRVSIASITEKGRALAVRAAPQHVRDVRRILFDHLTPEQTAALADAMESVAKGLNATREFPVGPEHDDADLDESSHCASVPLPCDSPDLRDGVRDA
jgi:DNA-binding MarR family transcriptional regulator